MSAAHTPGPWEVHQVPGMPDTLGHHVIAEGGLTVCSVTYQLPARVGADVVEVERRANARLIAAAPELLDALIWFVENDDTNEGMPGNEYWEAGLNAGRAAIAKALPVTTKDAEVSQ